jgi:rare lipoprotein A
VNFRLQAPAGGIAILVVAIAISLLTGCGHSKPAQVSVPPPPAPETSSEPAPTKKTVADMTEPAIPPDAKPISTEIGRASWYGPPYHNRTGSNGEIYNMHAMTAAHRTLPLGSIVRVTNLKTGHSALVRITDRGPFIQGRILDLSLAAARKVDVYLPGTAEVKVEVMQTPVPIETGGRWAVQIGAFAHEREASKFAEHLTEKYRTAKVQHFGSPVGDWWVRVRVLDDDRGVARKLAAETRTSEGAVFLVRLD